jgi:hypothetical protein
MRTDGRTEITKQIVAFPNFSEVYKRYYTIKWVGKDLFANLKEDGWRQ